MAPPKKRQACLQCHFLKKEIQTLERQFFLHLDHDNDESQETVVDSLDLSCDDEITHIDIAYFIRNDDFLYEPDNLFQHFVYDEAVKSSLLTNDGFLSEKALQSHCTDHSLSDLFFFIQQKQTFYRKFYVQKSYGLWRNGQEGYRTQETHGRIFVFHLHEITEPVL